MMMRFAVAIMVVGLAGTTAMAAQPAPSVPTEGLEGLGIPEGVASERVRWNKLPIVVSLPLNKERLVTFPENIRVGFPPELTSEHLRTQIVDGTIYWTALQPFDVKRLQVQSTTTGDIFLVDLSASKGATNTAPIEVLGDKSARHSTEPPKPTTAVAVIKPEAKAPDYAALTQMASQQLYAPTRLLKTAEGVHRAFVGRSAVTNLFHNVPISAVPLITWRSGSLYVTAVKLSNLGFDDVILDPRTLGGTWRTATFQHGRLFGKGDSDGRDVSAAYLISDRAFEEALHGRSEHLISLPR